MARRRNHYGDSNKFIRGNMSPNETLRELREMGEHVVQAAKNALRQGAEVVVADAKNRCPVKTGKLRDSIKAKPNDEGTVYKIAANAFKTDSSGRRYYYGQSVEFDPAINKPFLYPAMDAHKNEILEKIKDAISNAIRQGV